MSSPFSGNNSSNSYSLPPVISKTKRKAPSNLEPFLPDKKPTSLLAPIPPSARTSSLLPPLSSHQSTMKFDELMVRKWLKNHPEQAETLLQEYSKKEQIDSAAPLSPDTGTLSVSGTADTFSRGQGEIEAFSKTSTLPTEVIFDIARIIYSSLDLQSVLESVLSIAVNLISAERCSVFLLDKSKNELYTLAFDVGNNTATILEDVVNHQPSTATDLSKVNSLSQSSGLAQVKSTNEEDGAERSRLLAETTKLSFEYNQQQTARRNRPNPGIRVPVGTGLVGYVAQTRQGLNIYDAYSDPRFNPEVDRKTGFVTHSVLCLPIFGPVEEGSSQPELIGVASLVNKEQPSNASERIGFSEEDTVMFRNVLVLVGIAIRNAQLYETAVEAEQRSTQLALHNGQLYQQAQQETERTTILLRLAKTLYCEDNTKDLIIKIVGFAKELSNADKSSLFLVDKEKNQLYSTVFDNGAEKKMAVPMDKGLMGSVATHGMLLNIPDVYLDARFNPEIDIKTNYRTVSLLSMPVFGPKNDVIGVVNLINKVNPETKDIGIFDRRDETILESFSIFCGLALHKTMMMEALETQRNQLALTMEIMSFHATVKDEDVETYKNYQVTRHVPVEKLRTHVFDPHVFPHFDEHLPIIVFQMFQDLAYGDKYDISSDKLLRYILTVRHNYRPVAYHNFTHATSVTHTLYYLIVNGILDDYLDQLEMFSMLVACMNHDIDHRGTNNQFQKKAQTILASFYTTSVMERHHFNHAMTILNGDSRLNILSSFSNSQYRRCLHLIEHAILATDLSIFFANKEKCAELIKTPGGYNKQNLVHRDLLRGLLMTCSDLGAMFKPWEHAQKTADVVYEEFFAQGDEELRRGLPLSGELMDRNKMQEIPRMQHDFYKFVVLPAYELLYGILGDKIAPLLAGIRSNAVKWEKLKASGTKYCFGMDIDA